MHICAGQITLPEKWTSSQGQITENGSDTKQINRPRWGNVMQPESTWHLCHWKKWKKWFENKKTGNKHLGVANEDRLGGNEEEEMEDWGRSHLQSHGVPPSWCLTMRLQTKTALLHCSKSLKTEAILSCLKCVFCTQSPRLLLLEGRCVGLLWKNAHAVVTRILTMSASASSLRRDNV